MTNAVEDNKPTVKDSDLSKYDTFTKEYGQDGSWLMLKTYYIVKMQLDVGSEPTLRFAYVKCITYHNLNFGKVYTLAHWYNLQCSNHYTCTCDSKKDADPNYIFESVLRINKYLVPVFSTRGTAVAWISTKSSVLTGRNFLGCSWHFSRMRLTILYIVVKFQTHNTFGDMNYFLVWFLVKARLQTDRHRDRKRRIWAHRANCIGGLKNHMVLT